MSVAMLKRLRVALEEEEPIPGDARRWLRDGLRRYARGADSLDEALGLGVGPGQAWQKPARVLRREQIEDALVAAAERIPGSLNQQATAIADRLCGLDAVPNDASRILAVALDQSPREMPRSRTAILRILQRRCARNTEYSNTAQLMAQWRPCQKPPRETGSD